MQTKHRPHSRPVIRTVLELLARLDQLGLRLPKSLLVRINAVFQTYRRVVVWPRLARRVAHAKVLELRRDRSSPAIASFTSVPCLEHIRISERRYRDFLRFALDYPGNERKYPTPFVCTLKQACLHVPTGTVWLNRSVIVESVRGKVERALLSQTLPESAPFHTGSAATIMYSISGNYHHWLADCLPRLYLLAQVRPRAEVALLVPDNIAESQYRSLEPCLPDGVRIQEVGDEWVQVENLVLPSFLCSPPMLPPNCLKYLRERIFRSLQLPTESARKRRLYVSRSATAYRRLVNEDEVIDVLSPLGFEVVRPEKLPFEEQVRLFHSAEVVVGPRGAGLTNIMFSTRAKVLEITSTSPFVGVVYFSLAYALGHEYHYLFAAVVGSDFEVNPTALRAALVRMGVGGNPR